MSKSIHRLESDAAIVDPNDDKLGRDPFCFEIARALANRKGRESIVISICGEWGVGKTTIKNFIAHHLKGGATIVDFNPWQWSGQKKLLEGFLGQLGSVFGKKTVSKNAKKLSERWKAFGQMLRLGSQIGSEISKTVVTLVQSVGLVAIATATLTSIGWLRWVGGITGIAYAIFQLLITFSEKFSEMLLHWSVLQEKSVDELKSAVVEELEKLEMPIVVFIDDIDRLDDEGIALTMQMVKENGNFPNLIYVLLFQKDIVEKALSRTVSGDGEGYLRKIVQEEFTVPLASARKMQKMLTEGLTDIIFRSGVSVRWQIDRWRDIFPEKIWPYFNTIRDVKRFLGSYDFYFAIHNNNSVLEVNPIDLILVEVLRLFENQCFREISVSFDQLITSEDRYFDERTLTRAFSEEAGRICNLLGENSDRGKRVKSMLKIMFPQIDGNYEKNEWLRDFRICDKIAFHKYFEATFEKGDATAAEIAAFMNSTADRDQMVALLKKAISSGTVEGLLDLIFVTRAEIPIDIFENVVTALFDVGDQLPEAKANFLLMGLDLQCTRIIYHRLKGEPSAVSSAIVIGAVKKTVGFMLPIQFLSSEDRIARERSERESFVLSEEALDECTSVMAERIKNFAEEGALIDRRDAEIAIYKWGDWSDGKDRAVWIDKVLQNPEMAIKLLRKMMGKIVGGGVERPVFPGKSVEAVVSLDRLASAIAMASELEPSDRINLGLLNKAIERKNEGKSYESVEQDGKR